MKKLLMLVVVIAVLIVAITGCNTDANIASQNLSQAAEMFELNRRVVFYNGYTGDYMLSIEGRCSIEADGLDKQLEVTCKIGPDAFKKHFLGLSDNVTYFVEQLGSAQVSTYHYKVNFKPESIIPDVNLDIQQ